MMKFSTGLLLAALLLSLGGCKTTTGGVFPYGLIYTHTVQPLDLNMNRTPVEGAAQDSDIKHFQLDVVNIEWDSNAIGDIIRRSGMDTAYFADLETLSVLGIWSQYTVHVYGR